ncbi:DNA-directed RNA polymerase subunit alpha C-terminal domain-containing protein [Neobacillus mesonae]|uniref:DNA-directed RNA polymerase subunit alpha C-terminal domain-containing protein n=1 Tax=Neobacillus mesonae TaxID=1193713 RepID=UPI002E238813|nr:DNA-directed RNA polymerase subunit alpha C-terminal domain-containing protein [Neobacillus mesonae]MED4206611.1 DNA-directed RNA polymerase subunit alpha C-terminal domain-containing protein [Neobacillus mesonae]
MFENKLDYWMEKRGKKSKYLAQLCGVSETTFSSWRKNKTQPELEPASIIAKALDITVDQLIYGEDEVPATDPLQEDIYYLDFSKRVYNALKWNDINTVEDLLNYDGRKIKKLGPKSMKEIEDKIRELKSLKEKDSLSFLGKND